MLCIQANAIKDLQAIYILCPFEVCLVCIQVFLLTISYSAAAAVALTGKHCGLSKDVDCDSSTY